MFVHKKEAIPEGMASQHKMESFITRLHLYMRFGIYFKSCIVVMIV